MTRPLPSQLLLVLGAVCIAHGCRRDAPTVPDVTAVTSLRAEREEARARPVVFGPATFTRDSGTPHTDTARFSARAGDTLTVVVSSSHAEGLNAEIELNGKRLRLTTEERDEPATMQVVAQDTNRLRVRMTGKPGSRVTILVRATAPTVLHSLRVFAGTGVSGSPAAAFSSVADGTEIRYAFSAKPGFARLRVAIDGELVSARGSLTMRAPHWIAVSAESLVVLDATEQALARGLRTMLTSSDPVAASVAFRSSVGQAVEAWGDNARSHFARIWYSSIDPVLDLPALVRLDSALAGTTYSIDLPASSMAGNVRASRASDVMAARSAQGRSVTLVEPALGDREPVEIILINGIRANEESLWTSFGFLMRQILAQRDRFPRSSTFLFAWWNPSLFTATGLERLSSSCLAYVRQQLASMPRVDLQNSPALAIYATCMARGGYHTNDITEVLRWARIAAEGRVESLRDADVAALARRVHSAQVEHGRHVVLLAHSEGSLLTQLALKRMSDSLGFSETRAPRCATSISLAGVGTNNWPLSDRHARFVVAKHDIVTQLPGDLRNWRPTTEDAESLALDSLLAQLQRPIPGDPDGNAGRAIAASYLEISGGIAIHQLSHYLNSSVIWPVISSGLDELYRTCAVGTVAVAPSAATVQLYGTKGFGASWTAIDGQPLATADTVQWSVDTALANVSPAGRLTAKDTPGSASLRARVRNTVGSASIRIADDSVRATFDPPEVTVTTRVVLGFSPPGPPWIGDFTWMKVSATAMSGASIVSAVITQQRSDGTEPSWEVPIGVEFVYFTANVYIDGRPVPETINAPTPPYRLVVTDSNGRITEKTGFNP